MVGGSIYHGGRFNIPWWEVQYTMDKGFNIPWTRGYYIMDKGFKIPSIFH